MASPAAATGAEEAIAASGDTPEGVWLVEFVPDDTSLLAAHEALLSFHADGLVQADFAVQRADAALPYTLAMIGFGIGAVLIGRLVDRFGIVLPLVGSTLLLGFSFIASALAPNLMTFAVANLLIGIGSSGTFAPLLADISHWFTRRLGIAVAICASGNYLGGAVWPPIVQGLIIVFAAAKVLVNLLIDISYVFLDPRIRY